MLNEKGIVSKHSCLTDNFWQCFVLPRALKCGHKKYESYISEQG